MDKKIGLNNTINIMRKNSEIATLKIPHYARIGDIYQMDDRYTKITVTFIVATELQEQLIDFIKNNSPEL